MKRFLFYRLFSGHRFPLLPLALTLSLLLTGCGQQESNSHLLSTEGSSLINLSSDPASQPTCDQTAELNSTTEEVLSAVSSRGFSASPSSSQAPSPASSVSQTAHQADSAPVSSWPADEPSNPSVSSTFAASTIYGSSISYPTLEQPVRDGYAVRVVDKPAQLALLGHDECDTVYNPRTRRYACLYHQVEQDLGLDGQDFRVESVYRQYSYDPQGASNVALEFNALNQMFLFIRSYGSVIEDSIWRYSMFYGEYQKINAPLGAVIRKDMRYALYGVDGAPPELAQVIYTRLYLRDCHTGEAINILPEGDAIESVGSIRFSDAGRFAVYETGNKTVLYSIETGKNTVITHDIPLVQMHFFDEDRFVLLEERGHRSNDPTTYRVLHTSSGGDNNQAISFEGEKGFFITTVRQLFGREWRTYLARLDINAMEVTKLSEETISQYWVTQDNRTAFSYRLGDSFLRRYDVVTGWEDRLQIPEEDVQTIRGHMASGNPELALYYDQASGFYELHLDY